VISKYKKYNNIYKELGEWSYLVSANIRFKLNIYKHQEDTRCLVTRDIAGVSVLVGIFIERKACKSMTADFQSLRVLRIS